MRLGKKQSEEGDGEHNSSKEEAMAYWVYILALLEVRRNETTQGPAIGGAK